MAGDRLLVALISEVFHDEGGRQRLGAMLKEARQRGAELAVLPELPFLPWSPAERGPRPEDAEAPLGPRHRLQAQAARAAGLSLLGSTIVEEPRLGRRNRALLFDRDGRLLSTYDKVHVPQEPGFWEQDHYTAGDAPPHPIAVDGFPVGIQICSDLNRPELCHALAAAGALAIVAPRATEAGTWERWRLVLRATAMTSCCFVVTVTRPRPEGGANLGGPAFVAGPDGSVVLESFEPLTVISLTRAAVERARLGYPGYLAVRADLYRKAWDEVAATRPRAQAAQDPEESAHSQTLPLISPRRPG